ncbi:hypothetical protein ACEN9F_13570 [Duganella sp. CT11-25]|uniref:hypothetical protein n=1 Tax=unclassified Duganella TaxID=2636909 RepID=UPI0039AF1DEA
MNPTTYQRFCELRDQRAAGEEAPLHTEKRAFEIAVLDLVTGGAKLPTLIDLKNWLAMIHDNERSIGDRLQSLSSRIGSLLAGDAPDKFPPFEIREQPSACDYGAAVAAIEFALDDEDPVEFLRYWNEGEFDILRRNWPDAPEAVYIGADPLHRTAQRASINDTTYGT